MLGAQALRTKQVEQKEREKRQKERQHKLEVQRERIQKAANEDSQAAMLEYAQAAAAAAGMASTSSLSSTGSITCRLPRGGSASSNALCAADIANFSTVHALANGTVPSNRRIQQRYSLNANALSHLMPLCARESQSFDRIQIPHRSSTDYGKLFVGNATPQGHAGPSGSGNATELSQTGRFLRWLGFSNGSSSKKNHKRRMSSY